MRTLVPIACLAVVLLGGCLSPTEMVLTVSTNLDCSNPSLWQGVAIYLGSSSEDAEQQTAPVLTTLVCKPGGAIGSLVLVPSASKTAEVGIRVVAGIQRPPEECAAAGYAGCIVKRRTLPFTLHQSLEVQIDLASDCVGLACDAAHSCTNGFCEAANAPLTTPHADAGSGPTVRCGDDGTACPTSGDVCCLHVNQDAGTSSGDCRNSADCPPNDIVLQCDDESDCTGRDDAGQPSVCCLSYVALVNKETPTSVSGASCIPYDTCIVRNQQGLELCDSRTGCVDHSLPYMAANETLPGYFWCILIP